jgi:hypothetical protein
MLCYYSLCALLDAVAVQHAGHSLVRSSCSSSSSCNSSIGNGSICNGPRRVTKAAVEVAGVLLVANAWHKGAWLQVKCVPLYTSKEWVLFYL